MGTGIELVVLIPRGRNSENKFTDCFSKLLVPGRFNPLTGEKIPGRTHVLRKDDHPIRLARTLLVQEALAGVPEADFILFVDDDMTFDPRAAMRLIKRAQENQLDIVGGLCFNRRHPYAPTLFRQWPAELQRAGTFGLVYNYEPNALMPIDATGHGFILIRPSVFLKIREKQKGKDDSWYLPYDGEMSEDVAFCMRARELGIQTWVDTGCKIGHIASVVVDEEFAKRNRQFQQEAYWSPTDLVIEKDKPLASIIIPTYNQRPNYLKAAVLSAAYQTVPVEVIVVDDGSEPAVDPAAFAKFPNVRVVRHPANRGISAALNTGFENMKTDWFCWLSSDDLLDNRKVQFQLSAVMQGGAKASYTMFQIEAEKGFAAIPTMPIWKDRAEQASTLGQYCAINGSTVMLHREVFETVGGFDASYKYGQDWEFWCRVGRHYYWMPVANVLTTRRTDDNLTERIEADPELTAVRDAEDARIRATYGAM